MILIDGSVMEGVRKKFQFIKILTLTFGDFKHNFIILGWSDTANVNCFECTIEETN